jgi:hypothetical protein
VSRSVSCPRYAPGSGRRARLAQARSTAHRSDACRRHAAGVRTSRGSMCRRDRARRVRCGRSCVRYRRAARGSSSPLSHAWKSPLRQMRSTLQVSIDRCRTVVQS